MKTVFHATSSQPKNRDLAIIYPKNLLEDNSVDIEKIVVVVNVDGIEFLIKNSEKEKEIKELLKKGVIYKGCRNSMEARNLKKDELLDGVEIVPTAIGELTRLQEKNYRYIKIP